MKINVIKKSSTGAKVEDVCPWFIDMPAEKSRS